MSCPNFDMRNAGFPLYAKEDEYFKVCPECGCMCGAWADCCDDCGADLSGETAIYDEIGNEFVVEDVEREFNKLNDDLMFYSVSVESGRYAGLQFKIDWKEEPPEELDNEDCHYYFDMCRSVAIRKYKSETKRLEKQLAKIAEENGFEEYECIAIFSNGEAMYRKAV